MFSFNRLVIIWRRRRDSLEIGRPRSRGSKNFGRRWTRGVGGLENWTIFMDVICVLFLNENAGLIKNESFKNLDKNFLESTVIY